MDAEFTPSAPAARATGLGLVSDAVATLPPAEGGVAPAPTAVPSQGVSQGAQIPPARAKTAEGLHNDRFPEGLEQIPPSDRRNIIDHYKYWRHEAILADQDTRRSPLVIVAENYAYDFNLATTVRNANAFLPRCLWVVGRKRYDRRGTCGMHHYEHVHYAETLEQVIASYPDYRVVAIDNIDDSVAMQEYSWQPKTLMIFGQESIGVSNTALELADDVVYIPQVGAVRSLNVGTASGIALYDYSVRCGNEHRSSA